MEAKRDDNRVTSALGANGTTPVTLKAEHATGYLKAKIFNQTLAPPSASATDAVRDANRVPSALGTLSGSVKPLLVTNADGYLRAVNN